MNAMPKVITRVRKVVDWTCPHCGKECVANYGDEYDTCPKCKTKVEFYKQKIR